MGYAKIKNFSLPKDTTKRAKRQATGWEKKFAILYLYLTSDRDEQPRKKKKKRQKTNSHPTKEDI